MDFGCRFHELPQRGHGPPWLWAWLQLPIIDHEIDRHLKCLSIFLPVDFVIDDRQCYQNNVEWSDIRFNCVESSAVSYTHLTLPTIYSV